MKQRITVEQLQELTEEQRQRLREWWKPTEGDKFVEMDTKCYGYDKENKQPIEYEHWEDIYGYTDSLGLYNSYDQEGYGHKSEKCLPLLSIGQMIELLEDINRLDINIKSGTITMLFLMPYKTAENLCDALWSAVKEVL